MLAKKIIKILLDKNYSYDEISKKVGIPSKKLKSLAHGKIKAIDYKAYKNLILFFISTLKTKNL